MKKTESFEKHQQASPRIRRVLEAWGFGRAEVMNHIQRFISSSFWLGSEPSLVVLREWFPYYEWKCRMFDGRVCGITDTVMAITQSDFSWVFDNNGSYVTAKLQGRDEPLARCFYTDLIRQYRHGESRLYFRLNDSKVVTYVTNDANIRNWMWSAALKVEDSR